VMIEIAAWRRLALRYRSATNNSKFIRGTIINEGAPHTKQNPLGRGTTAIPPTG
jgi:hypothetical protein